MTIYLQQDFQGLTETPVDEVTGVSLTGIAATQVIQSTSLTADTFDATAFAVGRACHIRGMSSGDGAYRVTARASDGSGITLTTEGTAYSRAIPDFVSSSVEIRTGCRSTDLDTAFDGIQESTQDNPTLCRILADPVYGACLEKMSPALKTDSENNGWQFIGTLSALSGFSTRTEVWLSYWVLFRPGESYGVTTGDLTETDTTITFSLSSGTINDFPADKDAPYSGTVSWNNRECAMYVILGDPDTAGAFEVVGYASRSGSGPYTLTLDSAAWRGRDGTTAREWPTGTQVTIGYDFNHGHKMPGLVGGTVGGSSPGYDYCQARAGYVAYDYNQTPHRLGSPCTYVYNLSVSAYPWFLGKDSIPTGYVDGQVYYKQNQWQCVEMRVVMDTTAGAGNGVVDCYFDGVKVQQKSNSYWRAASASFTQWDKLLISTHWGKTAGDAPQKDERMLLTCLTVSDTRSNILDLVPPYGVSSPTAEFNVISTDTASVGAWIDPIARLELNL